MTDPHMTFIEAVAWIATRDSRFSDKCRDMTHRRLALSLAIRKKAGEVQYRSVDSAEKALLARCRSRPPKITATGLRGDISGPTAKRRTRIKDIEWVDIRGRAAEARTGRLMLAPKAGDDYWHEVTFTRAEVLAEFPVITEQAQSQIPPSGVVTEAIESSALKQTAEEAPPVSPEPATPNNKPASAPATGAEVLAEFPVGTEQAQSVVKPAKPKPERLARVTPKCPPMSQRTSYSLWQGITDEFPDGVPVTMTVPDVARQLAENGPLIARGIKKKNLTGGKHNAVLKRLLERTRK